MPRAQLNTGSRERREYRELGGVHESGGGRTVTEHKINSKIWFSVVVDTRHVKRSYLV